MADLPTNLKDDILDSSVNTRRKYRMIENGDGTYSFDDATEYSQVGDEYGAGLINETNKQVNARVEKAVIVRDLDTIGAITQPGFVPDALAVKDVSDSLKTMSQNFQAGVDTLYDKCVELGSTPIDKTPSAIADAMEGITKYAEGTLDPATYDVWYEVTLGFKPKILSAYFYWNNGGTMAVSIAINYSPYGGLDSRYIQITETGFKYKTTEASVAYTGYVKYAAAG